MQWRRDDYLVSDDQALIDLDAVHAFLSSAAYWSPDVPRDVVKRALAGSLVFGLYRAGDQIGLARVVTDRATFAWICDVYVVAEERGKGLGKWLMECVKAHPDLCGLRRWLLATRDAQGLYEQFGFTSVEAGRLMEIVDLDIYSRARQATC